MEQTITINIEKLIDKLEITHPGCVNLAELETSIQKALLKAVNSASFEGVHNPDTSRRCNSSRSMLSKEIDSKDHHSSTGVKNENNHHNYSTGEELPFVNIPNSNSPTRIQLRYAKVVDLPIKGECKEQVLAIIKDYLEGQSNDMSFNLHLMGFIKSKPFSGCQYSGKQEF
ncbi:MAG: hypothetical protein WCJ72_14095 [Chryseobacterium sp.]